MNTVVHAGLSPVRHQLTNGAVVLAQQTATHPAVTVFLSLHAGSLYDPIDRAGLAHFVSRVIDRGTQRRTADALAEELDGRGVTLNTSVARHLFTVSFTCLAEDLDALLDLAADVICRPTFPEAEIATRRGEVITAIRQDDDNPASVATETFFERLYGAEHPYGRRTKGTIEIVERLDRDALVGFHAARFAPGGLMAVLVGDVEPARAIASTAQAFGDWNAPPAPTITPPPAPRATHREQDFVRMPGKSQADIAYGFVGVARLDPDYYATVLLNNVLGQYGLGGRLGDSIRERQGMAYYAFSSFEGNVAEGPLLVRAGVAPENVDRTIASIDAEISRMVAEGVTSAELEDSQRYLIGSMPRMLETNGGIASFLQSVEFFGLGLDFDRRLPGLLDGVTVADVNRAARRLLDPARATIVVAGPPSPAAGGHCLGV
jgi:zinc protease